MSFLSDTLPGLVTTLAGGILDVIPGTQPIGIPLTAAGLGMFGAESTNSANIKAASDATDKNINSANTQMQFQAQMSNSAYQRATADMKAAGINPMMAITNGGASSPSGASGSAQMPQIQNAIGQGVQSAIQATQLTNSLKQTENQTKGTDASVSLAKAQGVKAMADANTAGFSAQNMQLRNTALSSELDAIASKAKNDKIQNDINARAAIPDAIASRLGNYSNSAKSVLNMFNPLGHSMMKNSPRLPPNSTLMDSTTGEIINEN